MKQVVVLSGKGGTGKTSLIAAFAHLAQNKVLTDADVDASNLQLVLNPQVDAEQRFMGGQAAQIDPVLCTGCNLCEEACRFDAISHESGTYAVDPVACDGCKACYYACPVEAIRMETQHAGWWYRSSSEHGPIFHAHLRPGQENSGRLVTLVKQHGRLHALDEELDYLLVDGPPGIGCPVISAASGADLAVIVVEPTVAGVHDLERVLETTAHFQVAALVVVNKADINPRKSAEIIGFCRRRGVEVAAEIPYDPVVTEAMVAGLPVTLHAPRSAVSQAMRAAWERVVATLAA
jgi:MinD superfamily P-loop ATPase